MSVHFYYTCVSCQHLLSEDHTLDWQLCQICYPLEIKLLLLLLKLLLLLLLEFVGETRIIIQIIIISADTPLVSNSFHFCWNPKYIEF